MEKPAENLLKWKDIDMPYCFCWANETWARSWSNITDKNTWADVYEGEKGGNGVLLEQEYGNETEWKRHFEYLLPFFCDKRYLKMNGKPIFLIYKVKNVRNLGRMLKLWEALAKENGLAGIYTVGSMADYKTRDVIDAELYIPPADSTRHIDSMNDGHPKLFDYDMVWENILSGIAKKGKVYFGGFVGYDDTPRRGKNGSVIVNASPEKFGENLSKLMAKNKVSGMDIVFLNAWNEWGEGMHLEPDEQNQYQYLEKINYAKNHIQRFISDYEEGAWENNKNYQLALTEREKYESYYILFDRWMTLREKRLNLGTYLRANGYKKIAVYGYGCFGRHFTNEVKNAGIEVQYIIDRNMVDQYETIKIYRPDEELPIVDVIVVTSVFYMHEIQESFMKRKSKIRLISLEYIISEVELWI